MAQKIADYTIGFSADTTQLKQQAKEIQGLLKNISSFKFSSATNNGSAFTQEMVKAASAAKDLQSKLEAATNLKTGKLDLTKFNQSLKQSGITLEQYATRLSAIGPEGTKAFIQVANAISQASLPALKLNGIMNDMWITMKNTMKWQLTSSMVHGFMSALSTSYGYAKDLNESLTNIRIVSSQSADQMERFARQANEAAKQLSTTTVKYTDAALIYYQQGLPDEQVIDRTNATIKMANVTGDAVADVSSQLTAIWNNFDNGTKSLEYYADVITALGAATASSSSEIANGLEKFASIADVIGLSYEYATSALATIVAKTRQSEDTVGTALKTIFARIQGLSLGETLEDGTDLNKYSKALQTVGIEIKDTSGEMKAMDVILDELGEKWKTLGKDEQMALAQTVAGVRQYTQLVSLMDNYDFFKDNVAIATGAEGTLQEQADIYAESWEAASKRVRAAAEQIYAAIFDDKAFIQMTNLIADALEVLGDFIDGMNGLQGVLPTVGLLFIRAFGPQLSQSLTGAKNLVQQLLGVTKQDVLALKQQAADMAANMDLGNAENTILARQVSLQASLFENLKNIGVEKAKILEQEIDISAELAKHVEFTRQQKRDAEELAKKSVNRLSGFGAVIDNRNRESYFQNNSIGEIPPSIQKQITDKAQELKRVRNEQGRLEALNQQYQSQIKKIKELETEKEKLQKANQQETEGYKQLESALQKQNIAFELISEDMKMAAGNVEHFETYLKSLGETADQVRSDLEALGNASINNIQDQSIFRDSVEGLYEGSFYESYSDIMGDFEEDESEEYFERLEESIGNITEKTSSWEDKVLAVGSAIMAVTMAVEAFSSLKDVWFGEEDLTITEKLTQTASALSMIILILGPTIFNAAKAWKSYSAALLAANTETQIAGRVQAGAAGGLKLMSLAAESATKNVKALGLILKGFFTGSGGIVAGLAIVAAVIAKMIDASIVTSKEAKENIQNSINDYEEAQEKVKSLEVELEEVNDKIKELKNQGPLEFTDENEIKRLEIIKEQLEENLKIAKETEEIALKSAILTTRDNFNKVLRGVNTEKLDTAKSNANIRSGIYEQRLKDYEAGKATSKEVEDAKIALDKANDEVTKIQGELKDSLDDATESMKLLRQGLELGIISEEEFANYNKEYTDKINSYFGEGSQGSYNILIKPVFEEEKFHDTINSIVTEIINADNKIEKDADWYQTLLNNKELQAFLETYGFTVDSFIEMLQQRISKAAKNIREEFQISEEELQETISSFDEEELEIFLSLNFEDFETWQEIVDYIKNPQKIEIGIKINDINDIINTLSDPSKSFNDLDETQVENLNKIIEKYGILNEVRIKGSDLYIETLKQIREEEEQLTKENLADNVRQAIGEVNKHLPRINLYPDSASFDDAMNDLLDADWDLTVAIDADIDSDLKDFESMADRISQGLDMISEGFLVTADNASVLKDVFPGILENATITAEGMIQLDSSVAQSAVGLANEELRISSETVIEKLKNENEFALAKGEALLEMSKVLQGYADSEVLTEQGATEAKGKLNELLTKFKATIAEEQATISNDEAESEQTDADNVNKTAAQAASETAINWADSFRDQAMNSQKAAQAMITNYNAVAQAAAGAMEGNVVTPGTTSGSGIGSNFSSKVTTHTTAEKTFSASKTSNETDKIGDVLNNFMSQAKASREEAAKAAEVLAKEAQAYFDIVTLNNAKIASIQAKTIESNYNGSKVGSSKKSGGGKKKGGGSGKDETPDQKELEKLTDRYEVINREIDIQNDLLSENEKTIERTYGKDRFKLYDKEIEKLEELKGLYKKKEEEAREYLKEDLKNLTDAYKNSGLDAVIDEEKGLITNYDELQRLAYDEYNKVLTKYNNASTKAAQEAMKEELKTAEILFKNRIDYLKQLQETLDVIRDISSQAAEIARKEFDEKLEKLNYQFQLVLDVRNAKRDVRDFAREIIESFSDELYHGVKSLENQYDGALENMDFFGDLEGRQNELLGLLGSDEEGKDTQAIVDELNSLRGEIISTGEELLDFLDNLEHAFPDALSALNDRFDKFIDGLKHNTTILQTINELLNLRGISTTVGKGYDAYMRSAQGQINSAVGQAKMQKLDYDRAMADLARAEATLARYQEGDAAYDAAYNNWVALKEETEKAQEAWLDAAKEALELAKDKYVKELEHISEEFDKKLSNMASTANLQQAYDNYIDLEDDFLDPVNRLYETTALNRKVQNALDSAANDYQKQILKNLQDEFDLRESATKLSEYDIEVMEAKYNMTLKQIALEEAQNNKNRMALFRDGQGNWTYRYTADQDAISGAQQEFDDAANEYYNLAKNRVKDMSEEIVQLKSEMAEKIREIYEEEEISEEERQEKIAIWTEFYQTKIQDCYDQIKIAAQDMNDAASESMDDYYNTYYNDIMSMINDNATFKEDFNQMIEDMKDAQNSYKDNTDEITSITGTDYEHLSDMIDDTNDSTEQLTDTGLEATDMMWDMADAVFELTEKYMDEAAAIMEVVRALEELARANGEAIESATQGDTDVNKEKSEFQNSDFMRDAIVATIKDGGVKEAATTALQNRWEKLGSAATVDQQLIDTTKLQKVQDATEAQRKALLDLLESGYTTEMVAKMIASFATGGYTGEFDNGRLAVLHEKELVLNQGDTQNMLDAVRAGVNFASLVSQLNEKTSASMAYLNGNISTPSFGSIAEKAIQQAVSIEANFPGVSAAAEIEAAFDNMINRAVQYASDRRY